MEKQRAALAQLVCAVCGGSLCTLWNCLCILQLGVWLTVQPTVAWSGPCIGSGDKDSQGAVRGCTEQQVENYPLSQEID